MSGMTFFSSPLRPSGHQSDSTPFYTPQAKPWTYAPPSPSPLRTSRNANLMPQKVQSTNEFENGSTKHDQVFVPSTTFFLNPTPPTTTNPQSSRATQFQYQTRARSSSPSVQLQSHTASNRDSRKRLFLDRLRTKRDDERFERGGDQLLRLDYIKQRQEWEAQMQKQTNEVEELEEDTEMQAEPPEELSSTEDKEIEELVSYLETRERSEDEFSDADYDALFMEMTEQELQERPDVRRQGDTDMDMS